MRYLSLCALLMLSCGSPEAEPVAIRPAGSFNQQALFQAGGGGYAHYRIPAVVVTRAGSVLVFTEARMDMGGDWGTIDILMRRSTDRGETFDAARKIVEVEGDIQQNPVALAQDLAQPGEVTYNNFAPIVDEDGVIHALFCVEYARAYYVRSEDDGLTWSTPVDVTATFEEFRGDYNWRVIATGPGHGIQLRNGRLVVPVWMSDGTGGHAHRPSAVSVVYSDDAGASWRRGDMAVAHPRLKNPSETLALELADGRVMLNIRHENLEHRRAISFSDDGATGWTESVFDEELLEPVCMGSLVRLSLAEKDGKNRILFANPHSDEPRDPEKPEGNHKRQNVSVKLSYDEGETWAVNKVVEPGVSGYSDLAVGPDGTIYLFYERGSAATRDTHTASLTLARFDLAWLTDGADAF